MNPSLSQHLRVLFAVHRLPIVLVVFGLFAGLVSRALTSVQSEVGVSTFLTSLSVGILSDLFLVCAIALFISLDVLIAKQGRELKVFRNQSRVFAVAITFVFIFFVFEWAYFDIFDARAQPYRLFFALGAQNAAVVWTALEYSPLLPVLIAAPLVLLVSWMLARRGNQSRADALVQLRAQNRSDKAVRLFSLPLFLLFAASLAALINPSKYLEGKSGYIAQSSAITLLDVISFPEYREFDRLYKLDRPQDVEVPYIAKVDFDGEPTQKNVLLIILERFNVDLLDPEHQKLAPDTFRIAKEGWAWNRMYAVNAGTSIGLSALFFGTPHIPGHAPIGMPNADRIPSVPGILKQNGYYTAFVYGGETEFANRSSFLESGVFDDTVDLFDYDESATKNGMWGVNDEFVLDKTVEVIENHVRNNPDKPYFISTLTLTNHIPFQVPDYPFMPNYESKQDKGIGYSSYHLGRLIESLKERNLLDNTLVLITGDHGKRTTPSSDNYLVTYKVPLIILGDDIEPKSWNSRVSQLDIAPTIFEMLNLSYESSFFGTSLLDDKPHLYQSNDIFDQGVGFEDEFVIRRKGFDRFIVKSVDDATTPTLPRNTQPSDHIISAYDKIHRLAHTLHYWLETPIDPPWRKKPEDAQENPTE